MATKSISSQKELSVQGLGKLDQGMKRVFDIVGALFGLLLFGWVIVICYWLARLDTGESGFFHQSRIGKNGEPFDLVKIRTMVTSVKNNSTVTCANNPRVTRLGQFLRKTKLDELPQLWLVLRGVMSFVGPRPDVPGFADKLQGYDRLILTVRPGLTGPATLFFRQEEVLLASVDNPEVYNRDVIFPQKVKINLNYIENYRFRDDILCIWQTVYFLISTQFAALLGC